MFHHVRFDATYRKAVLEVLGVLYALHPMAPEVVNPPTLRQAVYFLKNKQSSLFDRASWLFEDLRDGDRTIRFSILMTDDELETLASAAAFCDMCLPDLEPNLLRQDSLSFVRFVLKDHGIKNF